MNRNFKVATSFAIIFMLAYPVQANAGSECRDAKNSYKTAMSKYNEASKKWSAAAAKYEAEKVKRVQDCLRDTQAAIRRNPTAWEFTLENKRNFCDLIRALEQKPMTAQNPDVTYKRVMEIIVNYKKCFKVKEFLDAKQWLRAN